MIDYKTNMIKMIRAELSQSLRKCILALEMVRGYQIGAEYSDGVLRVRNNMGFTRQDSLFLTLLSVKNAKLGFLTEEEYARLLRLMPKYARQIFDIFCTTGKIQPTNTSKFALNSTEFF